MNAQQYMNSVETYPAAKITISASSSVPASGFRPFSVKHSIEPPCLSLIFPSIMYPRSCPLRALHCRKLVARPPLRRVFRLGCLVFPEENNVIRDWSNSRGKTLTQVVTLRTSKYKRHDPRVVRPKVQFETGFCETVVQFSVKKRR